MKYCSLSLKLVEVVCRARTNIIAWHCPSVSNISYNENVLSSGNDNCNVVSNHNELNNLLTRRALTWRRYSSMFATCAICYVLRWFARFCGHVGEPQ